MLVPTVQGRQTTIDGTCHFTLEGNHCLLSSTKLCSWKCLLLKEGENSKRDCTAVSRKHLIKLVSVILCKVATHLRKATIQNDLATDLIVCLWQFRNTRALLLTNNGWVVHLFNQAPRCECHWQFSHSIIKLPRWSNMSNNQRPLASARLNIYRPCLAPFRQLFHQRGPFNLDTVLH